MEFRRLANLDVLSKINNSKTAIIILHGYGAGASDLAPLSDYFPNNQNFDWYFPDGILTVPLGPMMSGKAWFPIDMAKFEEAMRTGADRDYLAEETPSGFLEAADQVTSFLLELADKYETIYLGGFSQGSMMAFEIAVSKKVKIDKLFLLSSSLVNEERWKNLLSNGWDLSSFQSHGEQDPVLSIKEARRLNNLIHSYSTAHQYHEFQGGHEIPPQVLQKLTTFLEL